MRTILSSMHSRIITLGFYGSEAKSHDGGERLFIVKVWGFLE